MGGGQKYMDELIAAVSGDFKVFIASPVDLPFGPKFQKSAQAHFALKHRSFSFLVLVQLILWAKKNRIKIIHSHGRGAGYYSRLMRPFGFRILHSFHGVHREKSLSGELKFWLDRLLHPFTDGLLFTSNGEEISAKNSGFNLRIPHDIIPPYIKLRPSRPPRPARNVDTILQLGSLARLDPAKGIDLALKLLSDFKSRFPNVPWHYRIAGTGEQRLEVPENIRDQVFFEGYISEPYAFLEKLDVFIAPSRSESFNYSVLEALNAGNSCLISDIPGHDHYLEGLVALGFKIKNPASFIESLLEAVNNHVKPKRVESFLSNYQIETTREKYLRMVIRLKL
jgi:glycosyltransferase involved in cell wall biosynthesis